MSSAPRHSRNVDGDRGPTTGGAARTTAPTGSPTRIGVGEATFLAVAALAVLAVELIGIGHPSFWYDEAATYSGASRSLPALWDMLGHVDAVHGLYYVLQHPVVHLFGPDPVALRASSAVAVALTAGVLYLLARQFGPPLSAAAVSVVFVGLARTSWMATEARSFALATLVATALTLLLVIALRSPRRRWIVAYVVVAVFGVHLFVYVLLVVAAHACTVLWVRPPRRTLLALWGGMAVVAVLSVPGILVIASQRGQLGGTFPIAARTWSHVFVSEFFHRAGWQSAAAWLMLAVAVVVIASRSVAGRTSPRGITSIALTAVVLPWLVLPTTLIVVFSAISPTIYQPRALVICAPAFCVLFAECLRRAFGSWAAITGAAVILALGIPTFAANRELTAKGSDWPLVAARLEQEASPPDGILYSEPIDYHSWPSLIRIMHPDSVADLTDVTLLRTYEYEPTLFDARVDAAAREGLLQGMDRVWYVYSQRLDAAQTADDIAALEAAGLRPVDTWEGPRTSIQEWVRSEP